MNPVRTCLAGLLLFVAGCATSDPLALLPVETQIFDPPAIGGLLRRAPIEKDADYRAEKLTSSDTFSAHLLQLRSRQPRHVHLNHDVTLFVHRGRGEVSVDNRRRTVQPGDVFHVPRGVPHFCTNRDDDPLVIIAIFTPPFTGKDISETPQRSRSFERSDPP